MGSTVYEREMSTCLCSFSVWPSSTLPYVVGCCSVDIENQVLCKYTLKEDDLTKLRDAIEDLYYFEFIIGKFAYLLYLIMLSIHK